MWWLAGDEDARRARCWTDGHESGGRLGDTREHVARRVWWCTVRVVFIRHTNIIPRDRRQRRSHNFLVAQKQAESLLCDY